MKERDGHWQHDVDAGDGEARADGGLKPVREVVPHPEVRVELVALDDLPDGSLVAHRARRAVEMRRAASPRAFLADGPAANPGESLARTPAHGAAAVRRDERNPHQAVGADMPPGPVRPSAAYLAATRPEEVEYRVSLQPS